MENFVHLVLFTSIFHNNVIIFENIKRYIKGNNSRNKEMCWSSMTDHRRVKWDVLLKNVQSRLPLFERVDNKRTPTELKREWNSCQTDLYSKNKLLQKTKTKRNREAYSRVTEDRTLQRPLFIWLLEWLIRNIHYITTKRRRKF